MLLKDIESDLEIQGVFGIQKDEQPYTSEMLRLYKELKLSLTLVSECTYEPHYA
jgi:hypothetical protein